MDCSRTAVFVGGGLISAKNVGSTFDEGAIFEPFHAPMNPSIISRAGSIDPSIDIFDIYPTFKPASVENHFEIREFELPDVSNF